MKLYFEIECSNHGPNMYFKTLASAKLQLLKNFMYDVAHGPGTQKEKNYCIENFVNSEMVSYMLKNGATGAIYKIYPNNGSAIPKIIYD